jgi:hypothetical protein
MRPNPESFVGDFEYNHGVILKDGVPFVTIEGEFKERVEVGSAIRDFCAIASRLDISNKTEETGRAPCLFLEVDTEQITKYGNSETVFVVQILDKKTGKIGRVSLELSIPSAGPRANQLGAKITVAPKPGGDSFAPTRRTSTVNVPMFKNT